MLDLILIVLLIISIAKPDILLAKNVRVKANDGQKKILAKNLRKIYGTLIAIIELQAIRRYVDEDFGLILLIATIILLVLFFVFAIPGIKQNKEIVKNLK